MKRKTPPSMDGAFIDAIVKALKTHRPCVATGVTNRLGEIMQSLADAGIRSPNDWQPEWTGYFTMRWYDGDGDSYSNSRRGVQVTIVGVDGDCRLSLRGNLSDRYTSGAEGVSIPDLSMKDAVTVLRVLVEVIDKPRQENSRKP